MAILALGQEPEHFAAIGAGFVMDATNASFFRNAYSRAALRGANNNSGGSMAFTQSAALWWGGRVYLNAGSWSGPAFLVFADAGNERLRVYHSTTGILKIAKFDGSVETILATAAVSFGTNTLHKMDVHVDYSATGFVRIYFDGTLYLEYSGDVTAGGSVSLSGVKTITTFSSFPIHYSEIIVADEDTRTLAVATLPPNAAGDSNGWAGAYTDIDEATASSADVISSDTAGQVFLANLGALPAASETVRAVAITVSAINGAGGPQNLDLGVKTGGSEDYASAGTLSGGYTGFTRLMELNPVTGVGWTRTEIDTLQLALRSAA